MIYIRVHIIPTANDDGSKAAKITADEARDTIKSLNELYKQVDLSFIFDPETDFGPIRQSTLLNQDMLEVPNADTYPPDKYPGDSSPADNEKDKVGKEYPGKLVIFVGCGDRYSYDDKIKKWIFASNGNWCSGQSYVRMGNSQPWQKYAHEIGHYLTLGHTYKEPPPRTEPEATTLIQDYVDKEGHPAEKGADVFDGDRGIVGDTPPDPDIQIFKVPDGPDKKRVDLFVQLKGISGTGMKHYGFSWGDNVMSNWPISHISFDQGRRIRLALAKGGYRDHLTSRHSVSESTTPFFSFESYNYPGMFIRHALGKGEISKIEIGDSLDAKDATFALVTGLTDCSCTSFESFNYPGYVLRNESGQQLQLEKAPYPLISSESFLQGTTFRIVPGLADPSAISFESRYNPKNYIRHRDGHLWVEPSTINPATFNQDATFRIVAPRVKHVFKIA